MRRLGAALLVLATWTRSAQARFDDPWEPPVDYTAWVLDESEWIVGLYRLEVGVGERLQLSTRLWHNLFLLENFGLKAHLYDRGDWHFGLSAQLWRVDIGKVARRLDLNPENPPTGQATLMPIIAHATWSPRTRWLVDLGLGATVGELKGEGVIEIGGVELDLAGAGKFSNLYFIPTVQYRLLGWLAVILESRLVLSQSQAEAATSQTLSSSDGRTTVELHQEASANIGEAPMFNSYLSLAMSLDTFNLRAGAGWGHLHLPAMNVFFEDVTAAASPWGFFPELDVYWRW